MDRCQIQSREWLVILINSLDTHYSICRHNLPGDWYVSMQGPVLGKYTDVFSFPTSSIALWKLDSRKRYSWTGQGWILCLSAEVCGIFSNSSLLSSHLYFLKIYYCAASSFMTFSLWINYLYYCMFSILIDNVFPFPQIPMKMVGSGVFLPWWEQIYLRDAK